MTNLRELAVAAKQWPLNTFKPATEEDACIVGHTDQDGEFYPVLYVECEDYYAESGPLAAYLCAASPDVVIGLLDRIDRLEVLITNLHAAKGRYHSQLAACDLFDAVGLKNERPVK